LFSSCRPEKIADYIEVLLQSNFLFRKCKVSSRVLATEFWKQTVHLRFYTITHSRLCSWSWLWRWCARQWQWFWSPLAGYLFCSQRSGCQSMVLNLGLIGLGNFCMLTLNVFPHGSCSIGFIVSDHTLPCSCSLSQQFKIDRFRMTKDASENLRLLQLHWFIVIHCEEGPAACIPTPWPPLDSLLVQQLKHRLIFHLYLWQCHNCCCHLFLTADCWRLLCTKLFLIGWHEVCKLCKIQVSQFLMVPIGFLSPDSSFDMLDTSIIPTERYPSLKCSTKQAETESDCNQGTSSPEKGFPCPVCCCCTTMCPGCCCITTVAADCMSNSSFCRSSSFSFIRSSSFFHRCVFSASSIFSTSSCSRFLSSSNSPSTLRISSCTSAMLVISAYIVTGRTTTRDQNRKKASHLVVKKNQQQQRHNHSHNNIP